MKKLRNNLRCLRIYLKDIKQKNPNMNMPEALESSLNILDLLEGYVDALEDILGNLKFDK